MNTLNHTPVIDITHSTTGCCTLIEPSDWDEQTFVFDNKPFVKVVTRSLFHIPMNMGSVMRHAQARIDDAGARADDFITLSSEISPWHAEHYLAVTKELPNMDMARLSGTFITKVFEGPFVDAPDWQEQLVKFVKSKGFKPLKTFFFYTTCPSCSRIYGKNYVVGFEQVEPRATSK